MSWKSSICTYGCLRITSMPETWCRPTLRPRRRSPNSKHRGRSRSKNSRTRWLKVTRGSRNLVKNWSSNRTKWWNLYSLRWRSKMNWLWDWSSCMRRTRLIWRCSALFSDFQQWPLNFRKLSRERKTQNSCSSKSQNLSSIWGALESKRTTKVSLMISSSIWGDRETWKKKRSKTNTMVRQEMWPGP